MQLLDIETRQAFGKYYLRNRTGFEQLRVLGMSHADVSVCLFNTSGSSIHSSKVPSNKTISKEHNKSSAFTVSKASHMVKSKCETAQQQINSADLY
jgi:hypothetical protein